MHTVSICGRELLSLSQPQLHLQPQPRQHSRWYSEQHWLPLRDTWQDSRQQQFWQQLQQLQPQEFPLHHLLIVFTIILLYCARPEGKGAWYSL